MVSNCSRFYKNIEYSNKKLIKPIKNICVFTSNLYCFSYGFL